MMEDTMMFIELQERLRHYMSSDSFCHYCEHMTSEAILDEVKTLFRSRLRLMRLTYPEINQIAKEAFKL